MDFKMRPNTIYIIPRGTFGDKNDNLQYSGTLEVANAIKSFVRGIGQYHENKRFNSLNLFIQGDSKQLGSEDEYWVMIEHWSNNSDLFFEFCEFVANKLNLNLELGL